MRAHFVTLPLLLGLVTCDNADVADEDCVNGLDDDGDMLTDCGDDDCRGHAACQHSVDADVVGDEDADALSPEDSGADADAPIVDHDADDGDSDERDGQDADVVGVACDLGTGESSYSRVDDSALACDPFEVPLWFDLYFDVTVPAGTEIRFTAQTSDDYETLDDAVEVTVATVPPDSSPASIANALDDASVANGQRYLKVTSHLSCDGAGEPSILHETGLQFFCQ